MKKTTIITLLLAIACLLCACSVVPKDQQIPISDYTNPPLSTATSAPAGQSPSITVTPSDPADLIGRWHSVQGATAFEFFADQTAQIYSLAPGYYSYKVSDALTYTYDGVTLVLNFSDGTKESYSCSVSESAMSITVSAQSLKFEPVDELPTEHPQYDFPDFDALAAENPLTLTSYIGNTFETDITKEDIQEELTQNTLLEAGTAKLGDRVNIDYVGKLNGVAFSGGTASNQTVTVNDGTGFIDGFATGIAGHEVGTTFDVEVTFPENYSTTDLAGKKVIFTMTLNGIYATELTDEIAIQKGYESVEAWVTQVYEEQVGILLWEKAEELKTLELPEEAYLFFYQYNLDMLHYNALYYFNNDFDMCLTYYGYTLESVLAESKDVARKFYQAAQIVAQQNLSADEALLERLTEEYLKGYTDSGYTQEQAQAILENEGKSEFQAKVNQKLAELFFAQNNTFTVAAE